jgi:hypothetical protein
MNNAFQLSAKNGVAQLCPSENFCVMRPRVRVTALALLANANFRDKKNFPSRK